MKTAIRAALAVLAGILAAHPSVVHAVPMCSGDTVSPTCCSSVGTYNCSSGTPITKKNVVLLISDDDSYCHYGFMGGLCEESSLVPCNTPPPGIPPASFQLCNNPGEVCTRAVNATKQVVRVCIKPCHSNLSCAANKRCMNSTEMKTLNPAKDVPLRLNDPACRNRQPARASNATHLCVGSQLGSPNADNNGNQRAFPFGRSAYPCAATPMTQDFPVRTPYIDELASQGAVFPRAHVGGNSCKPSRATMLFGKHHYHMQYLDGVPSRTTPLVGGAADCFGGYAYRGIPCYLPAEYRAFLWGKGEVANEDQAGFAGYGEQSPGPKLGTINDCDASCQGRIAAQQIPRDTPNLIGGIDNQVFTGIDALITPSGNLDRPFFVWYAPNLPHEGGGAPDVFKSYYAAQARKLGVFFGRISMFDVGVGAVVDGLQRRCVCNGSTKQSLYDNTVIMFITDNGFYMPYSKRNMTENTHRSPIVINDPRHRLSAGGLPAKVFTHDLAHSIDLVYTITSANYAGLRPGLDPRSDGSAAAGGYPYGKDLEPFVSGASTVAIRLVQYGQSAEAGFDPVEAREHYMIPRPGLIGVCKASPVAGHVRPCRKDTDCPTDICVIGTCSGSGMGCVRNDDCASGETCALPASETKSMRCANRPGVRCAVDGDCAVDPAAPLNPYLCVSGSCISALDKGSFGDFGRPPQTGVTPPRASLSCSQNQTCVPSGVCQPVTLKVQTNSAGDVTVAFDLNWDPDEQSNLLVHDTRAGHFDGDPTYLGDPAFTTSLRSELQACLDRFWSRDANGKWTPPATSPTPCPWAD